MPKRTNDFQEFVTLVQKALVPSGAEVTESALVDVPGMSEPREIDVLIETAVGPYHMKIAVEAKDHRRKMDSTQFESLMGKYLVEGGVKVNKVVIVTHNGYFAPVIQRAKQLGVELLTLAEAKNVDWARFRKPVTPFKTFPRICDIEVSPPISDVPLDQLLQDGKVFCSHGTCFGNVRQFAAYLLRENVFKNQLEVLRQIDEAARTAPEGKKGKVEFKPDHPHVIRLIDSEFPLDTLTFFVHFSKDNAPRQHGKSEFHFQFAPHICRLEVNPEIECGTPKELRSEGRLVCTCCDKDHGTLNEWASKVVFEGVFQRQPEAVNLLREALQQSPTGHAWLNMEWKTQDKKVVRFRGTDYPINSIAVGIHAISAKSSIEGKCYELQSPDGVGQMVSHLEATAGGKKFQIVLPHTEGGHAEKIVVKIDDAKEKPDSDSGLSGKSD